VVDEFRIDPIAARADEWRAQVALIDLTRLARISLPLSVEEEPLLLEGGDGTPPGLDQKIDLFFADWVHRKDPLTVACSHGDWIPEFLARYATIQTDVKKGAWAELDWDPTFSETRLTLRALHQRLG
jgi:hypothetical protein